MPDHTTLEIIEHTDTFNICMMSHVGCVREENQDYQGYSSVNEKHLVVVCDGMGGHNGGSISSNIAVNTMIKTFTERAEQDLSNADLLYYCIDMANSAIFNYASQNPELKGMGTTVVAVIVENNVVTLAHIGDSRAYFYRNGLLNLVTYDHSQVFLSVKSGLMTFEEAEKSDTNNLLLAALGVESSLPFEKDEFVQTVPILLSKGDKLLLCSDGLTGVNNFSEEDLIVHLKTPHHINAQVNEILTYALERQADDNVTVAVLEYSNNNHPSGSTALPSDVRDQYRKQKKSRNTDVIPDLVAPTVINTDTPVSDTAKSLTHHLNTRVRRYGLIGLAVLAVLILMYLLSSGEESKDQQSKPQIITPDSLYTASKNTETEETATNFAANLEMDHSARKKNPVKNSKTFTPAKEDNNIEVTPIEEPPPTEDNALSPKEIRVNNTLHTIMSIVEPKIEQKIKSCTKTKIPLQQPKWCPDKVEELDPHELLKELNKLSGDKAVRQALKKHKPETDLSEIHSKLKTEVHAAGKRLLKQHNESLP